MSSATNNKRGGFEEEFRRRLQDAEASPSADLWARIDHSLTVQESGQYRRGMLFYRHMAAACITLLLVAGGFAAYYFSGSPAVPVAAGGPQSQHMAAAEPAGETAPAQAPPVAEPIASAMQEAVRPRDPEPRAARPSIATAVARAEASSESIPTAHTATPVRTTSDPGAWHSVAAGKYTAAAPTAADHASLRMSDMRSRLESISRVFAGRSTASSGFVSPGGTAFAGATTPAPADDFRKLNEAVMGRMRQLKEEQEAALQTHKQETKTLAATGMTDTKKESTSSGKWSLGMAYAPSYFEQNMGAPSQMTGPVTSFASFAPSYDLQQSARLMDEAREEHEEEMEPGFSFGVEVKAGRRLGKKWRLLSGLGFTQNTARSKSSYVMQQFWHKPGKERAEPAGAATIFVPSLSSNYASDSLSLARTEGYNVVYRYRHLTVPVGVQYEGDLGKDWFWFGGGGVAANILLQTSILASSAEVRDMDYDLSDGNSPFRKLQWSGNVTAGVGKRLSNNLSVAIGPEYRAYFDTMLSSPEKAQAPQGKPYTIGVNLAFNYDLGPGRR